MPNGTGIKRSVLSVQSDTSSIQLECVFQSTITAKLGIQLVPVPTVMLATFSKVDHALKETHSARHLTPMELVPHATLDTFLTTEAVSQSQNWPPLPSFTLNVVLKNWQPLLTRWEVELEDMFNSTHDVFADLYLYMMQYQVLCPMNYQMV